MIKNDIQLLLDYLHLRSTKQWISEDEFSAFLDWILNQIPNKKLKRKIEDKPNKTKTQQKFYDWLNDCLADQDFRDHFKVGMKLLPKAASRSRKNRLRSANLDIGGNFDMGDKVTNMADIGDLSSNTVENSHIKVSGDFNIGNRIEESPTINTQINIEHNHTALDIIDEKAKEKSSLHSQEIFMHGYALIIGIGVDLPGSINDAQALYDTLTNPSIAAYPPENVRLLCGHEATKTNIEAGLEELQAFATQDPEATIVIFYSGHGIQTPSQVEHKNDYFLLPHDFMQSREDSLRINGRQFSAEIEKIASERLFVVLDCCHAQGVLSKSVPHTKEIPIHNSSLVPIFTGGKGKVIIGSCRDEEVSLEVDGHGLFTTALLEALMGCNSSGKNDYVHMLDVLQYVLITVPIRSKKYKQIQHPVISQIKDLDARFYICQYQKAAAKRLRKERVYSKKEIKQLKNPSHQTIDKYQVIKNQINLQDNYGNINVS